ncbi:hypothetical protein SCALM49S_01219 [Streptomyces californicus]
MSKLTDVPKRILIGRALRSDKLGETLLPKRIALPVFASDPLSSVAYAPGEVLLVLSIAGVSAYHFSPWIAVAVVVLMFTVVASYRQNVHAYPSGGGDYEVATTNLGPKAGLTVASALLVDYVLTVAVSISSGVENLGSAVPFVVENKTLCAVGAIVLLTLMNLRGVKESGKLFAVPTYLFVAGVFLMILWGSFRGLVLGDAMHAPTSELQIKPEHQGLAGFALVFLLLRAFSSGCAALTGVEAISNGVPAFRKPKSKNAATTLALMGLLAVTMFCGIIGLALVTDVKMAENPAVDLLRDGVPVGAGYTQDPVIAQVAEAVFGHGSFLFMVLAAATALVFFLAANTAYNGFPLLGSILAQDRYLPRQLHTRGDRLAFSNGIVLLGRSGDPARLGLRSRLHEADPALHRRGVRLLHPQPDRHGPALEPPPDRRTGPGQAPPDHPLPRHQRLRRVLLRRGPGDRPRHQVHPRRVGGAARDGHLLRHDDRDPEALRPGRRRDRRRRDPRRGDRAPLPRPRHRPRLQAPPPHAPRPRLRPADPGGPPGGALH